MAHINSAPLECEPKDLVQRIGLNRVPLPCLTSRKCIGEATSMDLLYYRDPDGNFGDDLNLWFWDEILPEWRDSRLADHLVGIGTLLGQQFMAVGLKLVLGSGVGYGRVPDIAADPSAWDIRAVRGPKSAAALGLDPQRAFTDPAVLLPDFPQFANVVRSDDVILVPHHRSMERFDWDKILAGTGIRLVDPREDTRKVIGAIAGARLVIGESMHAVIIADSFRVPWRAMAIGNQFNRFKWEDWAQSLELNLSVMNPLLPLRTVQRIMKRLKSAGPVREPSAANVDAKAIGRRSTKLAPLINVLVRRSLRSATREKGQLSDTSVMERQKRRLSALFETVRADLIKEIEARQQSR